LQLTPPKGQLPSTTVRRPAWSQGPIQVGVAVSIIRAGETVARSIDARRRCSADPGFQSPVTRVKQRKRRQRVLAIKTRSLNDPRQSSLPTVQTVEPLRRLPPRHLLKVQTDACVPIRPGISIPAQRVSRICAETDDLAADAVQARPKTKRGFSGHPRGPRGLSKSGWRSALSGRVKRWHARSMPGAAAAAIDDKGETKNAAKRFSAIRMRSLNDPRQSSSAPVQP
jgi:hypothetical protein